MTLGIFEPLFSLSINSFETLKFGSCLPSDNICVGIVFVVLNVYNIYLNTLGDSNNGIVLVKYSIQGKSYTIMKRSTQRSIYLQVLLFSANGIYTTFVDKTMKLMVFATGNIYKSTGTASEEVENTTYSLKINQENQLRASRKAPVSV